jgi:hypothetical protein
MRGDLVLAQPGATAVLETATLRIQARVVDIEYGPGPMPAKSFFQKLTLELAAWHKEGAEAPAPAAPPEMMKPVMPPAPVFTPPPAPRAEPVGTVTPTPAITRPIPTTPSGPPIARPPVAAPPVPAMPPSSPPVRPPAAKPTAPDDDPFGGAADF